MHREVTPDSSDSYLGGRRREEWKELRLQELKLLELKLELRSYSYLLTYSASSLVKGSYVDVDDSTRLSTAIPSSLYLSTYLIVVVPLLVFSRVLVDKRRRKLTMSKFTEAFFGRIWQLPIAYIFQIEGLTPFSEDIYGIF
ncbi:hypothetical protein TWF569_008020 [Orbilia oligospora]|uniref:Uncharacterized protein n=1 Tax=Orbilia oligospora TaxID=2813651 RepID=A0A7C8NTP7_ORBOL|nr:hypothetical protein TWF706_011958 [Orbilia oligospora]KAF3107362.1 hypothetical protein TWF102_000281 [Orbilia oligospora]KAF3116022.1 hypothetical protein TWF103_010247 [Orbilia oligospora]KAF3149715.1 hypothetical protein TWF594_010815 [Orbilia oligospora]KAF3155980.1 hypothetical protein TWF569_008020 [Orbilia oligospora]